MVGNNYGTHPPFLSRHLVPQHVGNIIFVCYFLNIGSESKKVNVLSTSPRNQFRDYFIWNRIEKLMPQHWNCSPQTLKTFKQLTNLFSNLDFLPKSGFPKTLDLSMDFPKIFHGFPTPLIFGEPMGIHGDRWLDANLFSSLCEGSYLHTGASLHIEASLHIGASVYIQ